MKLDPAKTAVLTLDFQGGIWLTRRLRIRAGQCLQGRLSSREKIISSLFMWAQGSVKEYGDSRFRISAIARKNRMNWMAPMWRYPGEDELQALAEGALREWCDEEQPRSLVSTVDTSRG